MLILGGGAPMQTLAPGRWRPSVRHWMDYLPSTQKVPQTHCLPKNQTLLVNVLAGLEVQSKYSVVQAQAK